MDRKEDKTKWANGEDFKTITPATRTSPLWKEHESLTKKEPYQMRFKEINEFARRRNKDKELHFPPNLAVPKRVKKYMPVTQMKKSVRNGETMRQFCTANALSSLVDDDDPEFVSFRASSGFRNSINKSMTTRNKKSNKLNAAHMTQYN